MRRATLRMTLESSTIKQVFMAHSFPLSLAALLPVAISNFTSRGACRDDDVEHALDLEHDHQLAFEPVNAGRHARKPRVEIDRIGLARFVGELEHFADASIKRP